MAGASLPIERLQRALRGPVLAPGAPGYDVARTTFNALTDRRPAVIACCAGTDDVAAAVDFARREVLPVAIRGGGHSVAGHSVCEGGLVIDLRLMHQVRVDPASRRLWAGGGANWRDVDAPCAAHRLAMPGGTFDTTGVAGLTLGGGIGHLMGMHGLTLDNLASADVVLADGSGGDRLRGGTCRPLLGASRRRRQLRRGHRVRVRAASAADRMGWRRLL